MLCFINIINNNNILLSWGRNDYKQSNPYINCKYLKPTQLKLGYENNILGIKLFLLFKTYHPWHHG